MAALWWTAIVVSVLLYICLTQFVLPTVFFKPRFQIRRTLDRGIVNYTKQNGRSILYQPKKEYSKYISQYILSVKDNKTTFMCKIPDTISFINYDIVLFTSYGRAFSTINVKENIKKAGYTQQLEVPNNTAYATVIINSVDGFVLNTVKERKINSRNVIFSVIVFILSMLQVFFIKECMGQIYADVFKWDFMSDGISSLILASIGLALAALNLGLLFVNIKIQKRREA